MGKGHLVYSNSVEVLFEHLKINLFPEGDGVFSERLLIAPSQGMRQWLHMQLASSLSIACGLHATYLNQAIQMVCEKLFVFSERDFPPTHLELVLALEGEIDTILHSSDPLWHPLIHYIQGKESRKISLIKYLVQLFERYGIYGGSACKEWEARPSNWQEALWGKIYKERSYPQKFFEKIKLKEKSAPDLSIHLFAFSHLSPLHYHFFLKVAHSLPVYFYQLSPCQEFWSDLSSDHPSLLGSMGKVGKEMARLIEISEIETEDAYLLFGGNTRIRQLQRDLVKLEPTHTLSDDDSLQIHVCITPHQEIENLYTLLCKLFSQGLLEPKDVIVMAPQITTYAPYIPAVFGDTLPYQIADLPLQRSHLLAQGLFLLLDLEKQRWSAPAVLELFDHPLFCQKHSFTEEILAQIRTWVQQTGVRWAVSGAHRASLLAKGHCLKTIEEARATWMEGLGSLIEELALPCEPERINFTQAELLGTVVALIQALYEDVKRLDGVHPLESWASFLKSSP